MAGYNNFSKSNNAIEAELSGLKNATQLARWAKKFGYEGLTKSIIDRFISSREWHHTSCKYNITDYYDIVDFFERRHEIKKFLSEDNKKNNIKEYNMTVRWTEFNGFGKRAKPVEKIYVGAVIFKGEFAFFNKLKKKSNGNYISFFENENLLKDYFGRKIDPYWLMNEHDIFKKIEDGNLDWVISWVKKNPDYREHNIFNKFGDSLWLIIDSFLAKNNIDFNELLRQEGEIKC